MKADQPSRTYRAEGAREVKAALRSPDFIGIGAPKAGTTWLSRNIRQHPRIWQPPFKEVRYFSQRHSARSNDTYLRRTEADAMLKRRSDRPEGHARFVAAVEHMAASEMTDDWYRGIFGFAPARSLCGEISPSYAIMPPDGIAHLQQVVPNAKLVLCIRDPIERAWSHTRMVAKLLDIDNPMEVLERSALWEQIVHFSDYAAILRAWEAVFPRERILIISADDIDAKPLEVLQRLCRRLKVEYKESYFSEASKQIGVGVKMELPEEISTVMKPLFRPIYDKMRGDFPALAAKWAARYY